MPTAVRLKFFQITNRGDHQMQITLPRNWIREQGLKVGDSIELLKDTENRLILKPVRMMRNSEKKEN